LLRNFIKYMQTWICGAVTSTCNKHLSSFSFLDGCIYC
jgi:hypothetical protein